MRRPSVVLSNAALIVAAVVLLGSAFLLRQNTLIPFGGRDAFAARVGRGDRPMDHREIVAQWRSEIAAQQHISNRDKVLSRVMLACGVLVIAALGTSAIASRQTPWDTSKS
jgi:hypothetical protein